mgnify:CR=1 FL=1
MIAASLLACHSASALRVDSIGTRIARVDPAIWTAAAGIAATTRLPPLPAGSTLGIALDQGDYPV